MEERGLIVHLWGIPCPPEPQDIPIACWAVRHLPMELEKVYVRLDARHGVWSCAWWLLRDLAVPGMSHSPRPGRR